MCVLLIRGTVKLCQQKKLAWSHFFYRFTGDLNNGETSIGSSSTTSPEPVNFDDKRTNDEFKNEALEEKSDDTEDNISENIKYIYLLIFFYEKKLNFRAITIILVFTGLTRIA